MQDSGSLFLYDDGSRWIFSDAVPPPSSEAAPAHPTSAAQKALLVDWDITELRRANPPRLPPIPSNWRPPLLGGGKPWGSVDDALSLILNDKIEEGRELLSRIWKSERNIGALAALIKDLHRPKEDVRLSHTYMAQLPPNSCECLSLKAFLMFMRNDPHGGADLVMQAVAVRPVSAQGCAYLLDALMAMSDIYLQARFLAPRKREPEFIIVTPMIGAMAQLALRKHEQAWNTLKIGWLQSDELLKTYANKLKLEPTLEEAALFQATVGLTCAAGMARILWDLGVHREAAWVYAELADSLAGNLAYAAQTLAQC